MYLPRSGDQDAQAHRKGGNVTVVTRYRQPTIRGVRGALIEIRRYPVYVERLVDGYWQERFHTANGGSAIQEWILFEQTIGSTEIRP